MGFVAESSIFLSGEQIKAYAGTTLRIIGGLALSTGALCTSIGVARLRNGWRRGGEILEGKKFSSAGDEPVPDDPNYLDGVQARIEGQRDLLVIRGIEQATSWHSLSRYSDVDFQGMNIEPPAPPDAPEAN